MGEILMTPDLFALAGVLVLALIQILLFDVARTGQYGLKWNMSPRDQTDMPPLSDMAKRLDRAQANLFETLPIFIGAVLIAYVSGRANDLTALGAHIYLFGRIAYVPLYAYGISPWRSLAWVISLVGLLMVIWRLFV
jgi:uncharacterized MAPEG superfamily protein